MTTSFLADLEKDVRAALPQGGDPKSRPSSVQRFLEEDIVGDKMPWTIEGHEPFSGILGLVDEVLTKERPDVEISVVKAEQIGASITFLGLATHLAADRGRDVGYFLPTKNFAHEFGRTRLKRMVGKSPYLRDLMQDRGVVNQATVKEFGSNYLYLTGLETMLGAISKPLDVLMFDEVDSLPAENAEWAQGRVTHSDLRLKFYFSAGYAPGGGIDKRWQEGSQHRFLYRCRSTKRCGLVAICLEETFPNCVAEINGVWTRVCPHCKRPLDLSTGRWVATYPHKASEGTYSFRISALSVPAIALAGSIKRWFTRALKRRSEMAKFRSAVLALPDAGNLQPVTDEDLAAMRVPYFFELPKPKPGQQPRFAGLDTGGDLCHFYVFERTTDGDGRPKIVWAEEIPSDEVRTIVARRMIDWGVESLVIDKKPLTTDARALAYQFGRRVILIDFVESSVPDLVEETPEDPKGSPQSLLPHAKKYWCLKVNRDESIDAFTEAITDPKTRLIYPDKEKLNRTGFELFATFEKHLKNLRKEKVVDAKGRILHRYIKGVENHFGLAGTYAHLAEMHWKPAQPFKFTPIRLKGWMDPNTLRRSLLSG